MELSSPQSTYPVLHMIETLLAASDKQRPIVNMPDIAGGTLTSGESN